MNSGYVYILINQSLPSIIKIGKTKRDSKLRAKELSNTSIPTPFTVAFEVFSDNMDELEKRAHKYLDEFKISKGREFFRYPLNDAIKLLQDLNTLPNDRDSSFVAISIYEDLVEKYPSYLQDSITDVRILQTDERVWLEIIFEELIAGYLKDITIKRSDLGFIIEDFDSLCFNPNKNINVNARKFVDEFDVISILNTTDLFKSETWNDYMNK